MNLSLILCCYNSVNRLKPTLEHIYRQIVPNNFDWEVIVVDNASTDGTSEYIRCFWEECDVKIKLNIIHEEKPGLIYARISGVKVAKGDIIVFCDDDNWLDFNYVYNAYNIMMSNKKIGALGGEGIGVTDDDSSFPYWWNIDGNCNNFAVGKQFPYSGNANKRGYLWGAGLVSRNFILKRVFDEKFPFMMVGRSGKLVLSGEDSEICYRIRLLGFDLYYNENLKYKHYMPKNRLTDEYLSYLLQGFENVKDMHLEYKAAIFYKNLKISDKFKLFFVRYYNRLIRKDIPNKYVLYKQYNAYVLKMKKYVPMNYKVIYDFIKKYK